MNVPGLVAASPTMQEIGRTVERLAQSNVSVLVQGETGTGKEMVARAIHEASARAKRPVRGGRLRARCPPTLIASQLFGHERGAFTGADGGRTARSSWRTAASIFLDEIGELPLAVQPALLGVLERRSFRRLGGKEDIQVDVRVISATHRDLRAEANQGTFRADLYFRLAVARIEIPPLRERPEDIAPLVASLRGATSPATHGVPVLARRRWRRCAPTAGRATCASCATWWRARWRWGRINLDGLAEPVAPRRWAP